MFKWQGKRGGKSGVKVRESPLEKGEKGAIKKWSKLKKKNGKDSIKLSGKTKYNSECILMQS